MLSGGQLQRIGIARSLYFDKKIIKEIKSSKTKVQASIQGDELRISGKKRDDLQSIIQLVKNMSIKFPLQYVNFRD